MGNARTRRLTVLTKAQVEALLHGYDADPIAALTSALRVVLNQPAGEWPTLLSTADFPSARRDRLLAGEQAALDELAAELNETREIAR